MHNSCQVDISKWHSGSFGSAFDSLMKHFKRHGAEVGASSFEEYLIKATEFAKRLKGARTKEIFGDTPNVTRYYKNGKYIDMTPDGKIISFGSQ